MRVSYHCFSLRITFWILSYLGQELKDISIDDILEIHPELLNYRQETFYGELSDDIKCIPQKTSGHITQLQTICRNHYLYATVTDVFGKFNSFDSKEFKRILSIDWISFLGEKWQGPIAEMELCVILKKENQTLKGTLLPDFFELLNALGSSKFERETNEEEDASSIPYETVGPSGRTNLG